MIGFDVPQFVALAGLAFLVFVVAVVGHVRRDDRRWRNAIDSYHARTGVFPTIEDLTRPRRVTRPVVAAPVESDPVRWWLLDCPACDLSAHVPGTAAEIDAAVDWHNRTHHGTTRTDRATTRATRTNDAEARRAA